MRLCAPSMRLWRASQQETWCEAEIHRLAGEITLKLPNLNMAKAEAYFERALEAARQQQAKSWELRAAMSLARLWRDQGKVCSKRANYWLRFTGGSLRVRHARPERGEGAAGRTSGVAVTGDGGHNGGGSCHFSRTVCPLLLITTSLLACASAMQSPCRQKTVAVLFLRSSTTLPKREYLSNSRARVYIRTGPFWRRHYWHCPM
jgi:hypothetical protein